MTDHIEIRDAIINAAVTLAAQKSWEAVRLYDVAKDLNLTLDQIRRYFREKEDIADAWFGLHLPRPICLEAFLYTRLFRDSDTHFWGLDYRLWFDGICTVEHRTLFYSASVCH